MQMCCETQHDAVCMALTWSFVSSVKKKHNNSNDRNSHHSPRKHRNPLEEKHKSEQRSKTSENKILKTPTPIHQYLLYNDVD